MCVQLCAECNVCVSVQALMYNAEADKLAGAFSFVYKCVPSYFSLDLVFAVNMFALIPSWKHAYMHVLMHLRRF